MCVHNASVQLFVLLLLFYYFIQVPPTSALYLDFKPDEMESQNLKPIKPQGTPSWAVKIHFNSVFDSNRTTLDDAADQIAKDVSLINVGQVGELFGHYLFLHETYSNVTIESEGTNLHDLQERIERKLTEHKHIAWFNQQIIRPRVKRALNFQDPEYMYQWHLHNPSGMDINVTSVWENGITGKGVTVSVIDDGLEWSNPDILDNYSGLDDEENGTLIESKEGSWDLNSNDADPLPSVDSKGQNHHGTRCAGEIAAVPNTVCGVGVAYGAKVSGIRALDGPMTDSLEATAFNKFMQINDIYSCSWGPDDDGETVDGPHPLAKAALQHGVSAGRKGYGNIFVVASGNGGRYEDNCNFDGYANSIYTITVGAVDERGHMPFYAEECASMLAVTFSSGQSPQRSIVTTDWTLDGGTGCTMSHTGTSAAAPLAAGLVALMLEARPCLTWRDVQHIIVMTSTLVDEGNSVWFVNKAGFHHSHQHGFGLLNGWRMVNAAKVWQNVPWMTSFATPTITEEQSISAQTSSLLVSHEVANNDVEEIELYTLEHVQVIVSLSHAQRGDLEIRLICPSGTTSVIASKRKKDTSVAGFVDWPFSTVRCWGERPAGIWQLKVIDHGSTNSGILHHWKLNLYGSPMTSNDLRLRRYEVEDAMSGDYIHLNETRPCPPPSPVAYDESTLTSPRTLKVLCLIGGFALFMSVYYTVEQAFFNKEDKEEMSRSSEQTEQTPLYQPVRSEEDTLDNVPPFIDGIPLETLHLSPEEIELNYSLGTNSENITIENETNLTVSLPMSASASSQSTDEDTIFERDTLFPIRETPQAHNLVEHDEQSTANGNNITN